MCNSRLTYKHHYMIHSNVYNWDRTFQLVMYSYPHFSPSLLFRWIIFPLSSKGTGSDHWGLSTALLFTSCGIRKITTLARDHSHCSSNKSNEGDTRHFSASKSFPDTCIVDQVCACSEFPGIGKGQLELHSGFPILLPSPRALLLVQTCNSIVKNTGLAVPTSECCDTIEGSNAVQRAPMEGGPVCYISFGHAPWHIVLWRTYVPGHLRCYLGIHEMLPCPTLPPIFLTL